MHHGPGRGGEQCARLPGIEFVATVAKVAVDYDRAALGENALHFGRTEKSFTWERTDKKDALAEAAGAGAKVRAVAAG